MKTIYATPPKKAIPCPADCKPELLLEQLRAVAPITRLSKFQDGWYAMPKAELSKDDLAKVAAVMEAHNPADKPSYVLAAEARAAAVEVLKTTVEDKLLAAGLTRDEIALLLGKDDLAHYEPQEEIP